MSGMHLVRGMSTISTKKRKTNRKPGWKNTIQEHDAFLKRMGVKGTGKEYRTEIPSYSVDNNYPPTSDKICANGTKKGSNKYSGEEIIGIATTHKSNLMPISNKKDAVAASQMRR